ncbi:MAG: MlaD family protein [Propionibacteriales bacterium]|nr:MlaD family protein [Propionibacteriales bacterium]
MSRKTVVIGVCALSLGVAGWSVVGRGDTGPGRVVAQFDDAGSLEVGNDVRVDGVRVGEITDISLVGDDARVEMDLARAVLPLRQDVSLTIKPINILGESYVAVDPGSDSGPVLAEGAVVPVEQTSSAVDLQDVLDTLDDPTSVALAALVTSLGEGIRDGGQNVADVVRALAPTMADLDGVGRVLDEHNEVLSRLVESADPVAASLTARGGEDLDALVERARLLLRTLGDNRAAVEETVAELPAALREARTTLAALSGVADELGPTLRRARPVTRELGDISREVVAFSREADPALEAFGPLLDHAGRLLRRIGPSAEVLRGAGPSLRSAADSARPVADVVLDRSLGDLMSFVTKWALSTNGRDGASHYFRGVAHVTPASLRNMLGGVPGAKGPVEPRTAPRTGVGPGRGSGDSLLDGSLTGIEDLLSGLGGLVGSRSGDGGATGLSEAQEKNLLEQLLGGSR